MIWIKKVNNIDTFYKNIERYAMQGPNDLNIFNPWQDYFTLSEGVYFSQKQKSIKFYYESGFETKGGGPSSFKDFFVAKLIGKKKKWFLGFWLPHPPYLLISLLFFVFNVYLGMGVFSLICFFSLFSYIKIHKFLKKLFV